MVEFANRTHLTSYEDKTNPAGRRLELSAFVENGTERPWLRWIDIDGDGAVSLHTDHYVLVQNNDWIEEDWDIPPRRVGFYFYSQYKRAIDNYVSTLLYDTMRELDDYFYALSPLQAANSKLRQISPAENLSCEPPNRTYSYWAEWCSPYTITDFTIYDQELPIYTERRTRSVELEAKPKAEKDASCSSFTISMEAFSFGDCSIDSCCGDSDAGYELTLVGNTSDLSLVSSIRKFYDDNVPKLDPKKSNLLLPCQTSSNQ